MTRPSKPHVILAGAGPGDPSLMTLAAIEACREADVVFYDALISPDILRKIPSKKRVNVGKRGGQPSPAQEEINRRLISAARRGQKVVRLKGGDPFLFGRGGEEAEVLRKEGIRVTAVPGISAGIAAAAYAGFPLTDRRYASRVTFLTASSARRASSLPGDYRALVRLGGTWVFFMGLQALALIVKKLLKSGADPHLPAAVISRATTQFQRVVTAPLSRIAETTGRHRLESPALTIVGSVISLRPPPLRDAPVLVMRPQHQAGDLARLIGKKGGATTEYPILEIVPIQPNRRLERAILRLQDYDWIILTSGNTVRLLKSVLRSSSYHAKIAAIGPGTGQALKAARIPVHLLPDKNFSAEGLVEAFLKRGSRPKNIFIPQAEAARDMLVAALRRAGHRVDAVPIYRTIIARPFLGKIRRWVKSGERGLVPLTSASMAGAFSRAMGRKGTSQMDHLRLVSIGPITTAAAKKAGLRIAAESPRATIQDLVETLETVA